MVSVTGLLNRSLRLNYLRINNHSVLVDVEGPLPGPDDTRR